MELKHLQALLGIADSGSFSGAAQSLGTVQSNISAQVARLERELDAVLVDRGTGALTEEGAIVAQRARRIVDEVDALVADVVAHGTEVVGTVRVGMIGTTGRWLVPALLDVMTERFPKVKLRVADGTSTTLEPQLLSHQLDLAVVTLPVPGDELAASPLFEEDLMLVVPAGHPLTRAPEPLPLDELARIELLLPAPGTALRDEIDAVIEPAGVTLRPAMELDGLRLIASLTFDGHGPAILPASAVPRHLRGHFILLRLERLPRRTVGVAVRRRGLPSAPARVVADALYDVVHDAGRMPDGIHPVARRRG